MAIFSPSWQLNLSENRLCGLDGLGRGIYKVEGITAISDALRVTASLTRLNVEYNGLGDEGRAIISSAVQGKVDFDLSLRGEYEYVEDEDEEAFLDTRLCGIRRGLRERS